LRGLRRNGARIIASRRIKPDRTRAKRCNRMSLPRSILLLLLLLLYCTRGVVRVCALAVPSVSLCPVRENVRAYECATYDRVYVNTRPYVLKYSGRREI